MSVLNIHSKNTLEKTIRQSTNTQFVFFSSQTRETSHALTSYLIIIIVIIIKFGPTCKKLQQFNTNNNRVVKNGNTQWGGVDGGTRREGAGGHTTI